MAAAVLMGPCFLVFAEDEDLQNQLADVQQQMEAQEQKKNEAEAIIGSVFEKLRVIQDALNAAEAEYTAISEQLAQTEEKIADTQAKLEEAQARLDERVEVFSTRIRDIYMHGQLNYLDVVLGAKDFNDFANRVELLRRIIAADMELISGIREQRDQIHQMQIELEAERQRQSELKDEAEQKRNEIEQHKQEQQAILHQAETDKATAEAAYQELQASSEAIAETLRQRAAERAAAAARQAGSGYTYQPVSGSGIMIWPVSGVITSPYGYRVHPIFGSTIYHSGMDIGVDYGTPVVAADSGYVVEAGWLGGYGYAVVIDHGNGLSTLYGHNQSLAVSAGESVSQGQVISYAGSTGNSTGPHVHFEVRVNGETVDPAAYL